MTPAGVAGAVAIVQLNGNVENAMEALEIRAVRVGGVALRNFLGLDDVVITRASEPCLQIMPHGGTAIVRAIVEAMTRRGIAPANDRNPIQDYPEAKDEIEAQMLAALSSATSPLAIDLLLDQPRRWRNAKSPRENQPTMDAGTVDALRHLLVPPLVVVLGHANIGKSTLLNRLAGRGVAIVADEPGTTRDHVGVLLDLGGLTVRYVDTPGLRPGTEHSEIDAAALVGAMGLAHRADLVVLVADALTPFPEWFGPNVRLGLRSDRGHTPGATLCVSARTGENMERLVGMLRDALVTSEALSDPRPWRFWQA